MKKSCINKSPGVIVLACLVFSALMACTAATGGAGGGGPEPGGVGKTSAPITISHIVPEKAHVGEYVTVTITVVNRVEAEGLKLRLTAGEGLGLVDEGGAGFEADYGAREAGSTLTETVTVTPHIDGLLYLNVFVTGVFNGVEMVRTSAVPVNVGEGEGGRLPVKPGRVTTDSKGKKIIIMPAEDKNKKGTNKQGP